MRESRRRISRLLIRTKRESSLTKKNAFLAVTCHPAAKKIIHNSELHSSNPLYKAPPPFLFPLSPLTLRMSATPDPSVSSPAPSDLEETPAQRQARLRRERRNAKIQGDPNARLAAISNISGRKGPPPETSTSLLLYCVSMLSKDLTLTSRQLPPDPFPHPSLHRPPLLRQHIQPPRQTRKLTI